NGTRVLVSLASVVIIVAGLKAASVLFVPIVLGLFLAILSLPVLNWFHRRGIPRPLAVLLTILIDLMVLGGGVILIGEAIPEFQANQVEYAERLKTQAGEFSDSIDQQLKRFTNFTGATPEQPLEFRELFNKYWDTERVVALIGQTDIVERITSLASKSFIVALIMIFILAEADNFTRKFNTIRGHGPDLERFRNSSTDIQRYLALKTGVCALTGFLAWLACTILKIDFPVLWGLVAFILNYIPAVGSIIAAIPPITLALIMQGFWPAVIILGLYLAINIGIGNFLEPLLLGGRFGISTVVVMVSVLIWGFIWGPVGMFLAVPLTMMVKVMLDNTEELRWISELMGSGKKPRTKDEPSSKAEPKEA
ncbi:MAG: AI-2E family transporter, partial [Verrucomicrobiota bacterium]